MRACAEKGSDAFHSAIAANGAFRELHERPQWPLEKNSATFTVIPAKIAVSMASMVSTPAAGPGISMATDPSGARVIRRLPELTGQTARPACRRRSRFLPPYAGFFRRVSPRSSVDCSSWTPNLDYSTLRSMDSKSKLKCGSLAGGSAPGCGKCSRASYPVRQRTDCALRHAHREFDNVWAVSRGAS